MREFITAGYLEQTGDGLFDGKTELLARLSTKGREWLLADGERFPGRLDRLGGLALDRVHEAVARQVEM